MARFRRDEDGQQEHFDGPFSTIEAAQNEGREVSTKRGIFGWVLFILFRLPGKTINWLSYMFPQHGDVLSSRRRFGDPKAEVIQSLKFWFGIAFIVFWMLLGYYQLRGRYGW